MPTISLIAAVAEDMAIGKNKELLCHMPNDLKRFKDFDRKSCRYHGTPYIRIPS